MATNTDTRTTWELSAQIAEIMEEQQAKVAVAESCTGGLIAHTLIRNPGASNWFELGIVSYSNHAKEELLGVKKETLAAFGAVSEQTAHEMATRVRAIAGTTFGLASTGIAGPTGGTPLKPVGLVYIGLSTPTTTLVKKFNFNADRVGNMSLTVHAALEMLRDAIVDRTITS